MPHESVEVRIARLEERQEAVEEGYDCVLGKIQKTNKAIDTLKEAGCLRLRLHIEAHQEEMKARELRLIIVTGLIASIISTILGWALATYG